MDTSNRSPANGHDDYTKIQNHNQEMGAVDDLLKRELNTVTLEPIGVTGSGCCSDGQAYNTDSGKVFVKFNSRPEALEIYQGEYEGLVTLYATNTLRVPKPIKVIKNPGKGAMLVLEYLGIHEVKDFAALGEQVARLHMHNEELERRARKTQQTITAFKPDPNECDKNQGYVSKFGFHTVTHCFYFRQPNDWMDDWVDFYARKMENHIRLIEERHNDREARPLWSSLVPKLPRLFRGVNVKPTLLHGDLWRGNIGETKEGPVGLDPICLYGHGEFEISIAHVHGGFDDAYFDSYHSLIPKEPGFDDRLDLYLLHHYFQLWDSFGDECRPDLLKQGDPELHRARFGHSYKEATLDLLRRLDNKLNAMI